MGHQDLGAGGPQDLVSWNVEVLHMEREVHAVLSFTVLSTVEYSNAGSRHMERGTHKDTGRLEAYTHMHTHSHIVHDLTERALPLRTCYNSTVVTKKWHREDPPVPWTSFQTW